MFNSKADFHGRFSMDILETPDNDICVSSFLHIEWDYLTNMFAIYVGSDNYEKESSTTLNQKRVVRNGGVNSHIYLDFRSKYRREIQTMKVRLGKLYSKLMRDRKAEEEAYLRKTLTEAATTAFPDLLDPLILGGSLNEGRDS